MDPAILELGGNTALHFAVWKRHKEYDDSTVQKILVFVLPQKIQNIVEAQAPLITLTQCGIAGLEWSEFDDVIIRRIAAVTCPEETKAALVNNNGFDQDTIRIISQKYINIRNTAGQTALHLAIIAGHQELTKLLLDHGADPEMRVLGGHGGSAGQAALHLAVSKGYHNIVKLLLNHGVDPDIKDRSGSTALRTVLFQNDLGQQKQREGQRDINRPSITEFPPVSNIECIMINSDSMKQVHCIRKKCISHLHRASDHDIVRTIGLLLGHQADTSYLNFIPLAEARTQAARFTEPRNGFKSSGCKQVNDWCAQVESSEGKEFGRSTVFEQQIIEFVLRYIYLNDMSYVVNDFLYFIDRIIGHSVRFREKGFTESREIFYTVKYDPSIPNMNGSDDNFLVYSRSTSPSIQEDNVSNKSGLKYPIVMAAETPLDEYNFNFSKSWIIKGNSNKEKAIILLSHESMTTFNDFECYVCIFFLTHTSSGYVITERRLVAKKISDINLMIRGSIALQHAVTCGAVKFAEWLLHCGANVYVSDSTGKSALHYIARKWSTGNFGKHLEDFTTVSTMFELLLRYGSNINSQDYSVNNVMCGMDSSIQQNGSNEICSAIFRHLLINFLKYEGNISAQNNRGEKLLHLSLRCYVMVAEVRHLMNCEDLDPFVRDLHLMTPGDYISCTECLNLAQLSTTEMSFNTGMDEAKRQLSTYCASAHGNQLFDSLILCTAGAYGHRFHCKHLTDRIVITKRAYSNIAAFHTILKDTRKRRNILHLFTQMQSLDHDVDLASANEELSTDTDRDGWTPLHYRAIIGRPQFTDVHKAFVFSRAINIQDRYGRTPLHYISMSINNSAVQNYYFKSSNLAEVMKNTKVDYQHWMEKGAEDNMDMFGQTAKELLEEGVRFGQSVADSVAAVNSKLMPDIEKRTNIGHFEASYGMVFCYNVMHGLYSAIAHDYESFNTTYEYDRDIAEETYSNLVTFMDRLALFIGHADKLFDCRVVPVGSSYEGTKIGLPDEYDFNLILTKFSISCEPVVSPASPAGFVHLRKFKHDRLNSGDVQIDNYFDNEGFLRTMNVKKRFDELVNKTLCTNEFWKNYSDFELPVDFDEVHRRFKGTDSNPEKCFLTLKLVVIRYLFQISVDIAPVIHVPGYRSNYAMEADSEHLIDDGCCLVLHQPHKVYPWIPISTQYARISFSAAESETIKKSFRFVKIAFKLAKHGMRLLHSVYGQDNSVLHVTCSSNTLKTALLHCLRADASSKVKRLGTMAGDSHVHVTEFKVDHLVHRLANCLLYFLQLDYIPSYFLSRFSEPLLESEEFLRHSLCVWSQVKTSENLTAEDEFAQRVLDNCSDETWFVLNQFHSDQQGTVYYVLCTMWILTTSQEYSTPTVTSENPLFEYFRPNSFYSSLMQRVHPVVYAPSRKNVKTVSDVN